LEELDLSGNDIDVVNVNAFRGWRYVSDCCWPITLNRVWVALQSRLGKLSLRDNSLSVVPSTSLIYLSHLQHLHLEGNHISNISTDTFSQPHQLSQLKFLHLDANRLTQMDAGLLKSLSSLQVPDTHRE